MAESSEKVERYKKVIETIGDEQVLISRQAGKPLLLLVRMAARGMGGWDGIWDGLCDRFSVAQFNLRRPTVEELKSPEDVFRRLAADCKTRTAQLGFDSFHILGWAGGTHVALRCAADYRSVVSSCTLVNPFFPLPDMRPVNKGNEFLKLMLQSGGRELYAYYWFMAGLSPTFVRNRFDEVENMVRKRVASDTNFNTAEAEQMAQWSRALRGFWISDAEMASIQSPVLVVGSGLDPGYFGPSPEMAPSLQSRVPGAQLAVAQQFGNLMLIESPETFFQLSDSFFARVCAVGGVSSAPS